MKRVDEVLNKMMSRMVSLDLVEIFGDLACFVNSVEKKGARLVVKVSDPTVLFVLRRMECEIRKKIPDIEEIRFSLSN